MEPGTPIHSLRYDNCVVFSAKLGSYVYKNHKSIFFTWFIGLLLIFFAKGLTPSQQDVKIFSQKGEVLQKMELDWLKSYNNQADAYARYKNS